MSKSRIGLVGLAVMGQNLALNIASHGFSISVWNRSHEKTVATVARAQKELSPETKDLLTGYEHLSEFVASLQTPRAIIILIQAGKPVDQAIESLSKLLEPGDLIIDGGNEWYENTERRAAQLAELKLDYMGMGVSGGEEGARFGPSLMPGGPKKAFDVVEPILKKIAAQVDSGPCVTHIGLGGSGNYVKMIHNGIEYGDMQLIAEAYDILKHVGGLTNDELASTFSEWNSSSSELQSFLIEITAAIFKRRDPDDKSKFVVDTILDKTGSKGTGKWTVQEAAENSIPAPTITASLDARYLSSLKAERIVAAKVLSGPKITSLAGNTAAQQQLITDVRHALYAAKICSYAQGLNIIRAKGQIKNWNLNLGEIARIWKGGCIIRAVFLDRIKQAYDRNPELTSLLIDPQFAKELNERGDALRRINVSAINNGLGIPSFAASLAYLDAYRRESLPANLTQAQRDYFGAHTYERNDKPGVFHTNWIGPQ